MGIRFRCPNGHKLNVKSFQAGMKGICPYCGAKFVIPTETTPVANENTTEPQETEKEETLEIDQQPTTVETNVGRTADAEPAVDSQSPGYVIASPPIPSERMQSDGKEKEEEQEPSKIPVIDQHSRRNLSLMAARQKKKRLLKIVVGLSVLAVVLMCVLVWILMRGV